MMQDPWQWSNDTFTILINHLREPNESNNFLRPALISAAGHRKRHGNTNYNGWDIPFCQAIFFPAEPLEPYRTQKALHV